MRECPNCGYTSNAISGLCGCTWSEQIEAARRKTVRKRKTQPVEVDYQSGNKIKT